MMKLKILLMVALMPLCALGQNAFKDGTVWTMEWESFTSGITTYGTDHSYISGTTEIDGIEALNLYHAESPDAGIEPRLVAHLKLDGERVYFKIPGHLDTEWYLMYDFGIRPGEGLTVYNSLQWYDATVLTEMPAGPYSTFVVCTGVDDNGLITLTEYNNENREYITCKSGRWLKGIGGMQGVTYNNRFKTYDCGSTLASVTCGDEVIYQNPVAGVESNLVASPVSVTSLDGCLSVSVAAATDVTVFNTGGVMVQSRSVRPGTTIIPLSRRGIYVVNVSGRTFKVAI